MAASPNSTMISLNLKPNLMITQQQQQVKDIIIKTIGIQSSTVKREQIVVSSEES
jgi:hypothetical protein